MSCEGVLHRYSVLSVELKRGFTQLPGGFLNRENWVIGILWLLILSSTKISYMAQPSQGGRYQEGPRDYWAAYHWFRWWSTALIIRHYPVSPSNPLAPSFIDSKWGATRPGQNLCVAICPSSALIVDFETCGGLVEYRKSISRRYEWLTPYGLFPETLRNWMFGDKDGGDSANSRKQSNIARGRLLIQTILLVYLIWKG
jgi:hypothetical protein